MADQRKTVAVVDGNSLLHRAFHAISANMTAPDGTPTNAVFGFMSMFIKLEERFKPWGIAVCFDKGRPRARMELLPAYKAQRPPMDPDLAVQFPLVKDLLAALSVPVVELEGWEGDDLLGTLAREGDEQGYDMLLVTGDRDMYQLSSDHVRVVSTRKGMSDVAVMTPEAVADLYGGITPELVPDFYGLKGDSSDNIPGVPGIGPKKAQQLLEKYGTLDEVLAHADEVKGKMGENLRAHKEDALLSRQVAVIRRDAPVDVDLAETRFPDFDVATAKEAFVRLGFTAIASRVLAMVGGEEAVAVEGADEASLAVPEPLEGDAAQRVWEATLEDGSWLGLAVEDEKDASTLFGTAAVLWVAVGDSLLRFGDGDYAERLVEAFGRGRVAGLDVKALIHRVSPMDSSLPAELDVTSVRPDAVFDVGVAAYLLDSTKSGYSASDLAVGVLGSPLPEDAPEAALEAFVACRCVEPLVERLQKEGAWPCFGEIEMPLLPVLAQMERCGMHADAAVFAEQDAELSSQIDALAEQIFEDAGERFNIGSPSQLSHVLFDVMGLPTAGLKKTKRGYYSTNAQVLDELSHSYDIVANVLTWREKSKIAKTYLAALPGEIRGDGRIHTTFNQTVTATGRISSSDPNLQNIPVKTEEGRRVRSAFTVPSAWKFLAVDYSQIELRLLAHLSGDEHLVRAFVEGEDFHAETAARVFGVPVAEVTPLLRSRAKAVNFGIVYGQQAYGLSQTLHIPQREAQAMIDSYYAAYPGVRRFLDETVARARDLGFATTMWGRRRLVPDISARNAMVRAAAERTAMNHPMQGSAADIIKIAMQRVQHALNERGLESRLIMQIHDELDLQVPDGELDEVRELVSQIMEGVAQLSVPLVADASWGDNWAEAK
ncbi:DNA polymerase I [Atopobiaceae bacterium 24-176]